MSYSRAGDLAELERLAWAANDRTTLALIELAEDAAGIKAEEARERRAELLAQSRGVIELRAELAAQTARMHEMQRTVMQARELENAVHFVLRPFVGKLTPKWAQHLRAVLQRIAIEQAK